VKLFLVSGFVSKLIINVTIISDKIMKKNLYLEAICHFSFYSINYDKIMLIHKNL